MRDISLFCIRELFGKMNQQQLKQFEKEKSLEEKVFNYGFGVGFGGLFVPGVVSTYIGAISTGFEMTAKAPLIYGGISIALGYVGIFGTIGLLNSMEEDREERGFTEKAKLEYLASSSGAGI
jgi:hypothetical protein